MGPYCRYCNHRCFTHITNEWPEHIVRAYGPYEIVATCPKGQAFEKETIGFSYSDFLAHRAKECADARNRITDELIARHGGSASALFDP